MKMCCHCGEVKPKTDFYKMKASKDGLTARCKDCINAVQKAAYAANPDVFKDRQKRRRQANPELVRKKDREHYAANADRKRSDHKRYRTKNPEKKADNDRRSYEKHRVKRLARCSLYYGDHKDQCLLSNKSWRSANKERQQAYSRVYRTEAGDRIRAARRWHYVQRKSVYVAQARRRELDKIRATPPWADLKAIEAVYAERERISVKTGIVHHVDHIITLRGENVCGLHVHYNLQVIPAVENLRKSNKIDPEGFTYVWQPATAA